MAKKAATKKAAAKKAAAKKAAAKKAAAKKAAASKPSIRKQSKGAITAKPEFHRAVLEFLNEGRRPEDIMAAPVNHIEMQGHERGRKRRVPYYHDLPGKKRDRKKPQPIMTRKSAEQILKHRDYRHPLGFTHVEQLVSVIGAAAIARIMTALSNHLGPASIGAWSNLGEVAFGGTSIPVAHGALLRTGKVLFIEAACAVEAVSKTPVWNPDSATQPDISLPTPPNSNLYCSGHAFLSDGRLLVVGGGGEWKNPNGDPKTAWIYDPDPGSSGWEEVKDTATKTVQRLNLARWYPTVVTLGDEPGRSLIASGRPANKMEVYSEKEGTFTNIDAIPDAAMDVNANGDKTFPQLYPGLHPMPGGETFYAPVGFATGGSTPDVSHAVQESGYFEFDPTDDNRGKWTDTGAIKRQKGMSALLVSNNPPSVKVIAMGGGTAATAKSFQIIDLSTPTPTWELSANFPTKSTTDPEIASRLNVNVVLLPDGTVFLCGGASTDHPCLLYNPETDTWKRMAKLAYTRQYHSLALLLPSGEVLATGQTNNVLEVFSPPYLNTGGTPPSITSVSPDPIHHGHTFTVVTPNAGDIRKMTLVRPMAVTHQTDSEQRVIPLCFGPSGADLLATAPDGGHPHALAPKGWYMLFIINNAGVPSRGKFVFLH